MERQQALRIAMRMGYLKALTQVSDMLKKQIDTTQGELDRMNETEQKGDDTHESTT